MATVPQHPAAPPNMPAVARILSRYDRDKLEAFLSIAIDLIDTMDGDPDLEDSNDREAHDGDDQGDPAWIEWHARGPHKIQRHGAERLARDRYGNILHEDDEEDDPSGQYDEDCYTGPAPRGEGAGCPISDPGGGNVEDERQMAGGQDYYPEKPCYGVDQTKGAINGHLIARRFDLKQQLVELEASGSREYARQTRKALTRIDKQEAALVARIANEN